MCWPHALLSGWKADWELSIFTLILSNSVIHFSSFFSSPLKGFSVLMLDCTIICTKGPSFFAWPLTRFRTRMFWLGTVVRLIIFCFMSHRSPLIIYLLVMLIYSSLYSSIHQELMILFLLIEVSIHLLLMDWAKFFAIFHRTGALYISS